MPFRPCPSGCSRFLSADDGHDRCLQCLGFQHAEDAFVDDSCACSNQIKSLLLSHHHSTSALVSEILTSVLQTVQKQQQQQVTYGLIAIHRFHTVFTDCTEDNVQNTYTQYTQCTIKTYLVINTHYTLYVHIHIMYTSIHRNM